MTINGVQVADRKGRILPWPKKSIYSAAAQALLAQFGAAATSTAGHPHLAGEMGTDVESPATTKELLALVIEINQQIRTASSGGLCAGVGFRDIDNLDDSVYSIRITGHPVADGLSEYKAALTYLPPSSERLVGLDLIAESSNFVKAHHVHVIEEAKRVLDWAVKEIKRAEAERTPPGD